MDNFSFWGDNPGPLIQRNGDIFGESGFGNPGDNLPKFYVTSKKEQLHITALRAKEFLKQTLGDVNETLAANMVKELFQTAYFDMIIEDFSEQSSEAVQVTKTIGGNLIRTYFNQNPKTIELRGKLLNTIDNDWYTKLSFYYNHLLRGTILTQVGAWIVLDMVDRKYYGLFDALQISKRAGTEMIVDFSMTFSVEKEVFTMLQKTSGQEDAGFSSNTKNAAFWKESGYEALSEVELKESTTAEDLAYARNELAENNLHTKSSLSGSSTSKNKALYDRRDSNIKIHLSLIKKTT